jgi:hypothetical protein
MFRPWNLTKVEIKRWLKMKELKFSQKDNKNPKLTLRKYLDKYMFSDLHEVCFYDFPHFFAKVAIDVKIQPPNKSNPTTGVESYGDCRVTTS